MLYHSLFFLFFTAFFAIYYIIKRDENFCYEKENYISISMDIPKVQTSSAKKIVDAPTKKEENIKPVIKDEPHKETTKAVEKN